MCFAAWAVDLVIGLIGYPKQAFQAKITTGIRKANAFSGLF
jgi:hypothetical protein